MESPNTSTNNGRFATCSDYGFTLLEVLVVLAIVTSIASLAALFSLREYHSAAQAAELNTLNLALVTARTRALAGSYNLPAGVAIYPDDKHAYTVFSGSSYENRVTAYDEVLPSLYQLDLASTSPATIVFSVLQATTTPATVVLRNAKIDTVSTVTVSYEGYIE